MKKMFTGDWGKLNKFLVKIEDGTTTRLLSNDVENLSVEFHEKLVKTLETHGASIGTSYGTVSESWHRTRQSGIIGYLRGNINGTYVGGMGNLAGYHTSAYAGSIRPRVMARSKSRLKVLVAPDRNTSHQYMTGDMGLLEPTPIWELAGILESRYPHWQPTIERLKTMINYKKLIDLQSLKVLLK